MTKLSEYLRKSGTRQTDFAKAVGLSQATVSRLASGSMRPSLTVALRIEEATGGAVAPASWVRSEAAE